MSEYEKDLETAQIIAQEVKAIGGRAFYVGGFVRDKLMGVSNKDIDIEVHGVTPIDLENILDRIGEKITVGVDAKNGLVAVSGWLETEKIDSIDFCNEMFSLGVKHIIYTDISKDGTLSGTNMEIYQKLAQINGLDITASGGITYLEEIKKLNAMGVYGAILGKAL